MPNLTKIFFLVLLVFCSCKERSQSNLLGDDAKPAMSIKFDKELSVDGDTYNLYFQVKDKNLMVFNKKPDMKEPGLCWLELGQVKSPKYEKGLEGKLDQVAFVYNAPQEREDTLNVFYIGAKFSDNRYSLINCYIARDSKKPYSDFVASLGTVISFQFTEPVTKLINDADFAKIPLESIEFNDLSKLGWRYVSANSRYRTNLSAKAISSEMNISSNKDDLDTFTKNLSANRTFKINAVVHKIIYYKNIDGNAPQRSMEFGFDAGGGLDLKWLDCKLPAEFNFTTANFLKDCTGDMVKSFK